MAIGQESIKKTLPPPLRRLMARALRGIRKPVARRYIPQGVGVEEFFRKVADASAACVVLRWFETLPEITPGEDIDMLVADSDLPAVARLLSKTHGSVPCDIYTVGGLPGTCYRDMAYFPEALGRRTIERRVVRDGLYQVPCEEDYFFGLAYHAVYQKGPASGLASRLDGILPEPEPDHPYREVLSRLADKAGISAAMDLDSLDLVLAEQGFRPTLADLRRLAPHNEWVARRFAPDIDAASL